MIPGSANPLFFAGAFDDTLRIGDFYEGGYFAGYISHTADGNATHGLIVAPAASGYQKLKWKTSNTNTSGTSNEYDGAINTSNMANADHPAANFCAGLSINGYSDWYLPARFELEIAYYNLKPTTQTNSSQDPPRLTTHPYAVPQRGYYTSGDPAQTSAAIFRSGGAQAFDVTLVYHWSSTQYTAAQPWDIAFHNGDNGLNNKTNTFWARAFRKFAL